MTESKVLSCAVRALRYHNVPAPPQTSSNVRIAQRVGLDFDLPLLRYARGLFTVYGSMVVG